MNILITGAWTSEYITEIEEMGHRTIFQELEAGKLPCGYDWVEGVICNGLFLYHPLSRFINLRYIQLTSAGYDRVPMQEAENREITVKNSRGVYSVPMAEFVLTAVLDLYKEMEGFRLQQKNHIWKKNRGLRELMGSRVLIVGCGSVGTECAVRFHAFGCRIIGIDHAVREDVTYDRILPLENLDRELTKADIVVLALPLTNKTRCLIDEKRLNMIKGILVNISRGAVVDRKALEQWEGAAVLDVFEEEPLPPDSPLWDKKNVIITPHNSFVGNNNKIRLKKLIISNLRKFNE